MGPDDQYRRCENALGQIRPILSADSRPALHARYDSEDEVSGEVRAIEAPRRSLAYGSDGRLLWKQPLEGPQVQIYYIGRLKPGYSGRNVG